MRSKSILGGMRLLSGLALISALPAQADPTEKNVGQFSIYHIDSVSEDEARGDILYCMGLASPALSMRGKMQGSLALGVVGDLMSAWMAKSPTDRMRGTVMDSCMKKHGYRVYRTDEATWKHLLNVDRVTRIKTQSVDAATVDAMAAFASHPLPADAGISL